MPETEGNLRGGVDISRRVKSARARLEIIAQDIEAVKEIGTQNENDLETDCKALQALVKSATEAYEAYQRLFLDTVDLVITMDQDTLFPTIDDRGRYTDVRTAHLFLVQIGERAEKTLEKSISCTSQESRPTNSKFTLSRLPKISLTSFQGDITKWQNFRDLFESLILNESGLAPIEKFHYLVGALEGDAKATISAIHISGENFEQAWNAIVEKYDNKRMLACHYLDQLAKFQPIAAPASVKSLRSVLKVIPESVASFKTLGVPDEADFLLFHSTLRCLDKETREKFEAEHVLKQFPTYNELITFIKQRCRVLELSTQGEPKPSSSKSQVSHKPKAVLSATQSKGDQSSFSKNNSLTCPLCRGPHTVFRCAEFRKLNVSERKNKVKLLNLCSNCFGFRHTVAQCADKRRCFHCQKKHNSLLHSQNQPDPVKPTPATSSIPVKDMQNTSPVLSNVGCPSLVLLGTAVVKVADQDGKWHNIRLVIDTGSQFSIITEKCAKRLQLPITSCHHQISGVGLTPLPNVMGKTTCRLKSRLYSKYQITAEPIIMREITTQLPTQSLPAEIYTKLNTDGLADPLFGKMRPVDFLVGNDLFMQILSPRLDNSPDNNMFETLPTIFGKVVMGKIPYTQNDNSNICLLSTSFKELDQTLRQFWETEEPGSSPVVHPDDKLCEEFFLNTHTRTKQGRYVVKLPFKQTRPVVGPSRPQAQKRLQHLESKLNKNPNIKQQYHEFLSEYSSLNHMSLTTTPSYYTIPHHAVFKANDLNAKIRVVFDASMKTDKGALNDKLYAGPKLQLDIAEILLNFRRYPVAFTADMVKMYRQILVHEDHRPWQHILWRYDQHKPIDTYQLNTLTYGTACAPYLALRVIKQLIHDEGEPFPLASEALLHGLYVDDIVFGSASHEEAEALYQQMNLLLKKGGFELHKVQTNSQPFSNAIKADYIDQPITFHQKDQQFIKILGLVWYPSTDHFSFQINLECNKFTKRSVLSCIAKLYDPLGFVSPIIMAAKLILQKLWELKLEWDTELPIHLQQEWQAILFSLPILEKIQIPRCVLGANIRSQQLIAFCDASEKGYGAVVYLRTQQADNSIQIHLLKAKSKLAPLKKLTIPRLELSAAWLLSQLLSSMKPFIAKQNIQIVRCFTDSTIVLGWLRMPTDRLKTFVSNRISQVLEITEPTQWAHVPGELNPADMISRGVTPTFLLNSNLWWHGPSWLYSQPLVIPPQPTSIQELPELKTVVPRVVLLAPACSNIITELLNRVSKYSRLIHALAYVQRFLTRITLKQSKYKGPLQLEEVAESTNLCLKYTQNKHLNNEFNFELGTPISGRLKSLNAFVDDDGIVRVGGRLARSNYNRDIKHPIILTKEMRFTKLLVAHLHAVHYHPTSRTLQALVRRKYWIFNLKSLVRSCTFSCIHCYKFLARPWHPLMGELPPARSAQGRPFIQVGTDFAGPFYIKENTRRNSGTVKIYVCIFVCMSTKAVHLEVVSGLSTELFLRALDRFISRRGLPTDIYSDNGTNYIGAQRQLQELFVWWNSTANQNQIQSSCVQQQIFWHPNPPLAPNFGGLWEAAVKSMKHHLRRVIGTHIFKYEEFLTLLCRIEALLNSRPLCPLSVELDNYDYLTPGHFIIGGPLLAAPEQTVVNVELNRLSRWQLVQAAVQHFWKVWREEYLHTLQQRPKWVIATNPVKIGDLVLLKVAYTSPTHWPTARILELHPGKDNITRVATIKTRDGTYKRPLSLLIPFPPPPLITPALPND